MNDRTIVAIDPGLSGGVCVWHPVTGPRVSPFFSAQSEAEHCRNVKYGFSPTQFYIEAVHASPVQGVSGAFKFGENFGIWKGIAAALGIKLHGVTPQAWQRPYAEELAGLQGAKRKQALLRIAKKLATADGVVVTAATADAYLLCRYLVECHKNNTPTGAKIL